ncbi:MAG TPA: DUF4446 family protein [Candidatus Limnocylindrales bacterium]|jgi:hypothetical protein|nr:DUF4446 family protein [Candidatus Limnocylindrales bacterium]
MTDLAAFLQANLPIVLAVLAVLLLLDLIASLALLRRVRSTGGLGISFDSGSAGAEPLDMRRVYEVAGQLHRIEDRTAALEIVGRRAVQRVGLVRYNPFEDTGSNQSFALALLDGDEDGLVISSLHSRSNTRIYAKPIASGRSEAPLSDEEAEALRLARSGGRAGVTA